MNRFRNTRNLPVDCLRGWLETKHSTPSLKQLGQSFVSPNPSSIRPSFVALQPSAGKASLDMVKNTA
jgi:hypothetical protein